MPSDPFGKIKNNAVSFPLYGTAAILYVSLSTYGIFKMLIIILLLIFSPGWTRKSLHLVNLSLNGVSHGPLK